MDYEKLYKNIVKTHGYISKPTEGYYERHHIVPACIGGKNDAENLIYISARCHLLLHWLLCRIYPKNIKLAHAFFMMCTMSNDRQQRVIPKSRVFEEARRRKSQAQSQLLKGSTLQFNSKESNEKRLATAKINKSYSGFNNGRAKPVDVYNYYTGELVASNILVTEWGKNNGIARNLNRTLYADRSSKSTSNNRHHAKGHYIVLHGNPPYPPVGGCYKGVYSNQGHIGLKKERKK